MPLLGKKVFVRQKPPPDLKHDEELFYCKLTHEVFREYEEFFERVILCNSLVWTCSFTGRPGLTYQEALDSERRARRFLKKFPAPLKQPVLFIATLTERGRLNDMCDDVFIFVKDRYFVGETVEVTHYGTTRTCEITKVIVPEKDPKSPVKTEVNGTFKPRRKKCINPTKVKYEVLEKEKNTTTVAKAPSISRPKGTYTRERNKLFLKQHTHSKNGVWKVKDEVVHKAGLNGLEFSDMFGGVRPLFQSSPTKKKGSNSPEKKTPATDKKNSSESGKKNIQGKLNFKKETAEEKKTATNAQQTSTWKAVLEKEEQIKKRIEEEKMRVKELKIKEKEKRKEEKRLWTEYINEWKKPRDDLECDDLKNLPTPTPVECSIPQSIFGDSVMILEFLKTFEKLLHVRNSFPRGFNFELLEKVLTESDIQGPLNDLVQLLLVAIFQLQDMDDAEWKEKENDESNNAVFEDQNITISKALNLACAAVSWPSFYHGTILRKMPLDPFSVTEILRLHLLASGADESGLYSDQACLPEDPGLWFKIEEPQLLKKLGTSSVFQLSPEERVKILRVLVHQLLSCSSIRNLIEENQTSLRSLAIQLKQLRSSFSRKLKETTGKATMGRTPKAKPGEKGKSEAVGVMNGDLEKAHEEEEEDVSEALLNGDAQKDNADGDSVNGSSVGDQMDEDKVDVEGLTSEQLRENEAKKTKELARLKQEFQRKEKEIMENIKRHQSFSLLEPIGRDRAYRRYWVFQAVPGVFVEDDDPFVGKCPQTKIIQQMSDLSAVLNQDDVPPSIIKKHLQQLNDNRTKVSNKENDLKLGLSMVQIDSASPLKVRTDLNPRVDLKKVLDAAQNEEVCLLCKDIISKDVNNGSTVKHCPHIKNIQPVFGLCTFSVDTCPVHNVKNSDKTKWAFFYKPDELESLLLNLNPRGFREARLQKVLLSEKEKLLSSISKCPYSNLNTSLLTLPQPEVRKSLRKQNTRISAFADINPDEALELTYRDTVLDLEENIYEGGLGSIKVPNREAWRTTILQRGYDMQCERLVWGPESKSSENVVYRKEVNGEVDDVSFKSTTKKTVRDMACALLQVSQSIEIKYLSPPLRETEAFKAVKQRVLDKIVAWETLRNNKRDCPKVPRSPMERWQEALMECTSFSQLFLHLSTLERSVAWSRSVLKAYCRTCKRRGDAENMLLCDGCDRGHHLYCLKPPLEKIPEGDWFCRVCKPPEKAVVARKPKYAESSDEEESYEESEQEEQSVIDEEEEEEDEEDDSADEEEIQNTCEICDKEDRQVKAGILLHCTNCRAAYHRKCLNLSEMPKGKWLCKNCQRDKKTKSSGRSTKSVWSVSSRRKETQSPSSNGSIASRSRGRQCNKWSVSSRRREVQVPSDSEQNSNASRNRARLREKRARSESLDVEEMPAKRFCRGKGQDRRDSSEVEENPFKKVYKDTARNNERRKSKSRNGDDSLDYKSCLDLLVELIKHQSSWPFLVPVNKKNAPNYHQIIKRPMDFGTIRTKLNNMSYRNNNDFVLDVYLVLQNCELFNPQTSPEYKAAKTLSKFVASLLKSYDIYNPFDSKGKKSLKPSGH